MIKAGEFREDLYYRISEVTVRIPPLRERAGDAVVIAQRCSSGARASTIGSSRASRPTR